MVMQNIQKNVEGTLTNVDAMIGSQSAGCQKIAMLTDICENGRQKCAPYFPRDADQTEVFSSTGQPADNSIFSNVYIDKLFSASDDQMNIDQANDECDDFDSSTLLCNYFLIKNVEIVVKNGYTIRKLCVLYLNRHHDVAAESQTVDRRKFYVYHYWFPDWPDHRSPDDIDVLLDMSMDLLDGEPGAANDTFQSMEEESLGVPSELAPMPIIHCSAGIGRTGCLAAILNGLRQMRGAAQTFQQSGSTTTVDILGIVCNLRLQRGGMVQNSEQYELIHRALCLYQRRKNKILDK